MLDKRDFIDSDVEVVTCYDQLAKEERKSEKAARKSEQRIKSIPTDGYTSFKEESSQDALDIFSNQKKKLKRPLERKTSTDLITPITLSIVDAETEKDQPTSQKEAEKEDDTDVGDEVEEEEDEQNKIQDDEAEEASQGEEADEEEGTEEDEPDGESIGPESETEDLEEETPKKRKPEVEEEREEEYEFSKGENPVHTPFQRDREYMDFKLLTFEQKQYIIERYATLYDDCNPSQKKTILFLIKNFFKVPNPVSVILTGNAGSGKTRELAMFILYLVTREKNVMFAAPANLAASNVIDTIAGLLKWSSDEVSQYFVVPSSVDHLFAGSSLTTIKAKDYKAIESTMETKYPNFLHMWKIMDLLIIDEFSMVKGSRFETLDGFARHIRKNSKPFAEIPLVICGGANQLPPIPDAEDKQLDGFLSRSANIASDYCFLTPAFKNLKWYVCRLESNMRIANDHSPGSQTLNLVLDSLADFKIDLELCQKLATRCNNELVPNTIKVLEHNGAIDFAGLKLFSLVDSVVAENNLHLSELDSEGEQFYAPKLKFKDAAPKEGSKRQQRWNQMHIRCYTDQEKDVYLKDFKKRKDINLDPPERDEDNLGKTQCLRVGAIVRCLANNGKDLMRGKLGIVRSVHSKHVMVQWQHEKTATIVEYQKSKENIFKIIKLKDKKSGQTVQTRYFKVGEIHFKYMPLRLAAAMSVHRAQGKTLQPFVINKIQDFFDPFQLYVALSRATSWDSIRISPSQTPQELLKKLTDLFMKVPDCVKTMCTDLKKNGHIINPQITVNQHTAEKASAYYSQISQPNYQLTMKHAAQEQKQNQPKKPKYSSFVK